MEKFLKWALMSLGVLMLLFMTALMGKSCYNEFFGDDPRLQVCTPDTSVIAQPQQAPVMFSNADEAVITQGFMIGEVTANDVFLDMPPECIKTVANVLIASRGSCTIEEIASEYRANRQRYNDMANHEHEIASATPPDSGVPLKKLQALTVDSTKTPPNT